LKVDVDEITESLNSISSSLGTGTYVSSTKTSSGNSQGCYQQISTPLWSGGTTTINSWPSYDEPKVNPDSGESINFDLEAEMGKAAEDKMKRDLSGLTEHQEAENLTINISKRLGKIRFYPAPVPVSKTTAIGSYILSLKLFRKLRNRIPRCYSCGDLMDVEIVGEFTNGDGFLLRCKKCGNLRIWHSGRKSSNNSVLFNADYGGDYSNHIYSVTTNSILK